MTVPQMYALLFVALGVFALGLLVMVVLTMRAVPSAKYNEGFNACKALMSEDQAKLAAENTQLRRKLYQLEGNPTRVYALLGDGKTPPLPDGWGIYRDRSRKGKTE